MSETDLYQHRIGPEKNALGKLLGSRRELKLRIVSTKRFWQ